MLRGDRGEMTRIGERLARAGPPQRLHNGANVDTRGKEVLIAADTYRVRGRPPNYDLCLFRGHGAASGEIGEILA
jgi:hypothetical protein